MAATNAEASYVALIRGINVGKAKRVAMADLRALVSGLGFGRVRTLLNSGNVVFVSTSPAATGAAAEREHCRALALRIQRAMEEELEVSAKVMVLSARQLDEALTGDPLSAQVSNPSRYLLAVLASPEHRAKLEALTAEDWGSEALALGQRVAYLWCPDGVHTSPLCKAANRALGENMTTRNWATALKLQALLQS